MGASIPTATSSALQSKSLTQYDDEDIHKISTLTTGPSDFVIKAKVATKSKVREFNQGKGKG